MNGNIVNCQPDTRTILTIETNEGGQLRSVPANLDGTPMQDNGLKYAGTHPNLVEVFLDTISGNHFAKVKASQLPQLEKADVQVFQGVGGEHGWFVQAPDFTVNGRHGGGVDEEAGPIEVADTPAVVHSTNSIPAKRGRKPAKKK